MRVLIVDDIVESIKGIRDHCEEQGWDCKICTFEEFGITLNEFNPDAIVLDWKDDADGENKGNSVLEDIWLTSYRPVIIFSGIATTIVLDEKYKNSNLIHIQPKGDEEPVIQYLNTIRGFVPVISALKADFNSAMIHALNSIKMISQTEYPGDNVFRYVLAKRVSTYFDKDCIDEAAPPWIQYIYPPITKTLCVCDIIRSIPTDGNLDTVGLAEEYKVLITPSCDMAQGNVSHVLCVNCYSKELFHGVELKATPSNGKIKSVTTKLNFGYKENFVSLPSCC